MAHDALIRLSGIHFAYAGRPALFEGMDFRIDEGDLIGLVGANGSGKTTLFRILVGLTRPTRGEFQAFGEAVRTEGDLARLRKRVGFLFQHSEDQLFCPTVEEDVAFGPLNLGESPEGARETAAEVLKRLGIGALAGRVSYRLSGGEMRLAALATVMALRPEVLLLDEPAAGLDPRAKRELIELLGRVGGAQVIASHDMEFIRSTCRRIVVMDGGRMIADGATDEILGNAELMLRHGLETPHSLVAESHARFDHRHGAGPSHGHGHAETHDHHQHE